MNLLEFLKVIFLGVIEGITEWLPISSTGHMLMGDEFLQLGASDGFKEMFFVVIQLGAILAVVLLFWKKMWPFRLGENKRTVVVRKQVFSVWFKVKAPATTKIRSNVSFLYLHFCYSSFWLFNI